MRQGRDSCVFCMHPFAHGRGFYFLLGSVFVLGNLGFARCVDTSFHLFESIDKSSSQTLMDMQGVDPFGGKEIP